MKAYSLEALNIQMNSLTKILYKFTCYIDHLVKGHWPHTVPLIFAIHNLVTTFVPVQNKREEKETKKSVLNWSRQVPTAYPLCSSKLKTLSSGSGTEMTASGSTSTNLPSIDPFKLVVSSPSVLPEPWTFVSSERFPTSTV